MTKKKRQSIEFIEPIKPGDFIRAIEVLDIT
jgi:hypothetical protein